MYIYQSTNDVMSLQPKHNCEISVIKDVEQTCETAG